MPQTHTAKTLDKNELASIKRKLSSLNSFELTAYIDSLLDQGKIQIQLVESLVEASNRSQGIYPGLLARCIAATESIAFFDACESKFQNSTIDLIPIFAKFYTKTIERRLCDYFYKELQSKAPFPHFSSCIDALTKNGRELTLETFEALEYEFGPKADLAKVISAAIQEGKDGQPLEKHEFLQSLTDKLTIYRLAEIRKAIAILRVNLLSSPTSDRFITQADPVEDIKTPGVSREFEHVKESLEDYVQKALVRAQIHKENAEQLLKLKRYADAGNNYRKSGEAILKAVYVISYRKTKVPTLLDHLKTQLKNHPGDILPATIASAIDLVQNIGNLASHDQSDNFFEPNEDLMHGVQVSLETISNWAKSIVKK